MDNEIKFDTATRNEVKVKLTMVEETLNRNVNNLTQLYDMLSMLSGNPEIMRIIQKTDDIRFNKHDVATNLTLFEEKMNMNLEQLIALDDDISNKIGRSVKCMIKM